MNYDNYFLKKKAKDQGIVDESGPTPESAYANMSRDDYEAAIKARNANVVPLSSAPEEAAEAAGGLEKAGAGVGSQVASQGAQSGNMAQTAGGALMMTGNPYAMAAGLGLQVIAGGEANKRAQQQAQREAYNERIARRQEMMSKIASMGIQ